ncbi:hypothetical protein NKDENANG_01922 [Candidatus Entotheonellaceae bacterium PAL068K]
MLSPVQVYQQVTCLTADLVGLSVCNHQNFPAIRDLGGGITEIGLQAKSDLSMALKNVAYRDVYDELERTQTYNLKMLDGALIQMMYRFHNEAIEAHRLAFFPSPYLEEFQNNPEIYVSDEMYAEVIMRNIVPFPMRFDFDFRVEVAMALEHPVSHLSLGQYENCRIPVSAALTPFYFISFVLRNFYHTAYIKYCDDITSYERECFLPTLFSSEKEVIHIMVPDNRNRL